MTMELPKSDTLFPIEEQYETAAWKATVDSLSDLWTNPQLHIESNRIPKAIRALAQSAFKDPLYILTIANRNTRGGYPVELIDLGILVNNRHPETASHTPLFPSETLSLMLAMYYTEDEILKQISEEAELARFDQDIDTLTRFNRPRLNDAVVEGRSIVNTLRTVHHDNIFYLGKWDNDRVEGQL